VKFRAVFATLLLILTFSLQVYAADQVYYYHTDPAGTPLSMTDSTGTVVWKADYKPFGEEYSVTGTSINNKRFVGKEKDEETGLSYFGARYEDAKIGRFISPDPVRAVDPSTSKTNESLLLNPQRLNTYSYALNNPYRYIDPDGRDVWDIGFFAYSAYNLAKEPTRENAVYFGLDTVGLIPVVPALGTIARVGKGAERAITASRLEWNAIKEGMKVESSHGLQMATDFLGQGYKEVASGVFRSADGTRQARITASDLAGHGGRGAASSPHINFEIGKTTMKGGRESFAAKEVKHVNFGN